MHNDTSRASRRFLQNASRESMVSLLAIVVVVVAVIVATVMHVRSAYNAVIIAWLFDTIQVVLNDSLSVELCCENFLKHFTREKQSHYGISLEFQWILHSYKVNPRL